MTSRARAAIIVAPADDEHAEPVGVALDRLGVPWTAMDVSRLEAGSYAWSGGELLLGDDADELSHVGGSRGWIRRLAPPGWRTADPPDSQEGVVRAAWVALLAGLLGAVQTHWLSRLPSLYLAENKLLQLAMAEQLRIPTPRSAVVSHRQHIPPELGEFLVVKPLGPAQFVDQTNAPKVVYASGVRRDDDVLEAVGTAPFLVQERLDALAHLRVVTVQDECWICELNAADVPLDWRQSDQAHDSFAQTHRYPHVGEAAMQLARGLSVGYSSQDWILTSDSAYFVDLNPSGQWLFLPQVVSDQVTAAIASWLAQA